MDAQNMPEDPRPNEGRGGDMGKGSFEQSFERNKRAPPSKQGPQRTPVRKQPAGKE